MRSSLPTYEIPSLRNWLGTHMENFYQFLGSGPIEVPRMRPLLVKHEGGKMVVFGVPFKMVGSGPCSEDQEGKSCDHGRGSCIVHILLQFSTSRMG